MLYPEPPRNLTSPGFRNAFSFVGPGVIIASVTIGSGELVWASRSGAIFGYQLLWCFLFAGVFKAVQVYAAARQMTLTGEHPLVTWKLLPGPPFWFPLLIALPTLLVMPIAFSGISEILGGFLRELLGAETFALSTGPYAVSEFWDNLMASVVLTTCLLLAIGSSVKTLERTSAVVLAAIVLCVFVAIVVCRPQVLEILRGLFFPQVPAYEPWVLDEYRGSFADRSPWLEVALYLTAVGGGTYDYIGYVGLLRHKRWGLAGDPIASRDRLIEALNSEQDGGEELRRAKVWIRAPLWDTCVSFTAVILVTLMFAVLGSLVLNPHRTIPDNDVMLSQQESFLTLLHPQLRWVYRGGVFLAFMGTLYGAFEIYQHTVLESARALLPRLTGETHLPVWRGLTVTYCYLGGMVMIWLPRQIAGDVVGRMTFGAVISGASLCGLWCLAMLWVDYIRLPRPLRMSWPLWCTTFIAGAVMSALGVQTMWVYFAN